MLLEAYTSSNHIWLIMRVSESPTARELPLIFDRHIEESAPGLDGISSLCVQDL